MKNTETKNEEIMDGIQTINFKDCCIEVVITGIPLIEHIPYEDSSEDTYIRVTWEMARVVAEGVLVEGEFSAETETTA